MRGLVRAGVCLAVAEGLVLAGCGGRTPLYVGESEPDAGAPPVDARPPPPDGYTGLVLNCPLFPDDPRLSLAAAGQPMEIDGREFVAGSIVSWRWEVEPQCCDAISQTPSYRLDGANSPEVTFTAGRPGEHWLTLRVEDESGQSDACVFPVPVEGRGLRISLCWDTNTVADLDLYLHRPDDQRDWYMPGSTSVIPGMDDTTCNGANGVANLRFGLPRVDWGYPDSPIENCANDPAMVDFVSLGRCANPRMGLDNNQQDATGTTEAIQLDNPRAGQTFRIMVQNFSNEVAHPTVFVHCGGQLAAELPPPEQPEDFVVPGVSSHDSFAVMWRPADITILAPGGADAACEVTPLRSPFGSSDYVTTDDPSY